MAFSKAVDVWGFGLVRVLIDELVLKGPLSMLLFLFQRFSAVYTSTLSQVLAE